MGQFTRLAACILFLSLLITPVIYGVNYYPNELFLTIYSDGYIDVSYGVSVDSALPRINIQLFGSNFEDIIIINQEEKPLDHELNGTSIVVDTIGSNNILISYSTLSLTSKVGSLWSIDINSPVNVGILLPVDSTIVSMSQIPLELSTVNNHPYILMPPGNSEVDYLLGIGGTKEHALAVITAANLAIQNAEKEGRTSNIALAKDNLLKANEKYSLGEYQNALNYATQAIDLANSSKNENNFILILVGLAVIIIVGSLFYFRRRPTEKPKAISKKTEKIDIDVDNIFTKHLELRMDDKEVIRFIADSGGEIFANEIRDRFDIPRTSAWRMIRRLIGLGIVEEKKIGGQSLIKITEKYRKEKKPKTEN